MSNLDASVDRLKAKYPFGSLYLTYIPLNDMTYLLNEKRKFAKLATKPPFEETLQVFKAFLDSKRERHMSEAVAFVQMDLNTGQAGFKRISDRDAAISPIPWSQREVWGIAGFCDTFLNNLLDFEEKHSSISAGKAPLAQAWESVKDLKKDPYIPAVRTDVLLRDFKSLVDKRPEELKDLGSKNRKVYTAIKRFSTGYHKYLVARSGIVPTHLSRQRSIGPRKLFEDMCGFQRGRRSGGSFVARRGKKGKLGTMGTGSHLFSPKASK